MTSKLSTSHLFDTKAPRFLVETLPESGPESVPQWRYKCQDKQFTVRVIRGRKMRTREALMSEVSAALQFYGVFGENWHALKDCLYDLDECQPSDGYVVVLTEPLEVLREEPEQLQWFLTVFQEIGDWWANPVTDNGPFNRAAKPFHVVFEVTSNDATSLLEMFKGCAPDVSIGLIVKE